MGNSQDPHIAYLGETSFLVFSDYNGVTRMVNTDDIVGVSPDRNDRATAVAVWTSKAAYPITVRIPMSAFMELSIPQKELADD